MENLKQPATAFTAFFDGENTEPYYGFTKLEKAALMIAAGFCGGQDPERQMNLKAIATTSVHLAKAVIEEANK